MASGSIFRGKLIVRLNGYAISCTGWTVGKGFQCPSKIQRSFSQKMEFIGVNPGLGSARWPPNQFLVVKWSVCLNRYADSCTG